MRLDTCLSIFYKIHHTIEYYKKIMGITLTYLINAHVHLFFFRKKSGLCDLIRYCALINFGKIFHPVRLLDTVRLLFLTNILPCAGFLNYVRSMGSNFGQYLREVFVCTIIFYRNGAFWYSLFILLHCVL